MNGTDRSRQRFSVVAPLTEVELKSKAGSTLGETRRAY